MPAREDELEQILGDPSKRIAGDIAWAEDEDLSLGREFLRDVKSASGRPLLVRGAWGGPAGSLRFSLLLRGHGKLAALDVGHTHRNPGGGELGRVHLHRWTSAHRDRAAEPVPLRMRLDLLRDGPNPFWALFCQLVSISHEGQLLPLPARQEELW